MSLPTLAERLAATAPHVTALTILLDQPDCPGPDEVLERLRLKFGITSTTDLASRTGVAASGRAWARVVHVEDYPFPFVLYALDGPANMPGQGSFGAERDLWEPERVARLQRHGSALEVETVLVPAEAQAAYGYLLKIAALAGGEDPVAFVDADSARVFRPLELYDLTTSAAPPSIADLYRIVGVGIEEGVDSQVQVTTRGLRRAMLPDLHLPLVPIELLSEAADLFAAVAGQFVLLGTGEEGKPNGLLGTPVLFTWHRASALWGLDSAVPQPEFWVVLLSPEGPDAPPPAKLDAAALSERGTMLLQSYLGGGLRSVSPFETRIRETRARERAPVAFRVWRALAERDDTPPAVFDVKIGFPPAAAGGTGSAPAAAAEAGWHRHVATVHCWFRARDVAEEAVAAELMTPAPGVPQLRAGDVAWYRRDQFSDWRLVVDGTAYGPDDMLALRALLARLEA